MNTIKALFIAVFIWATAAFAETPASPVKTGVDTLQTKDRRAFWLHLGLGSGHAKLDTRHHPEDYIFFHSGANYVRGKTKYTICLQGLGTECWEVGAIGATIGYCSHSKHLDFSMNVGPSFSQWSYNTESKYGTINSPTSPGLMIKIEGMPHLPQLFGVGLYFVFNISKEATYTATGVAIALGKF